MSGTNQLQRPLGPGVPLPGGNVATPPRPRGGQNGAMGPMGGALGAGSAMPRGPTLRQMQNAVGQPSPGATMPQSTGGPEPPPHTAGGIGDLPDSFTNSQKTLMQQHDRNKAMFKQTGDGLKDLDYVRKELDHLQSKQDVVTMNDVVAAAGRLVSKGLDPMIMAGVLAEAPQEGGGEALGGWVANMAMQAMTAEQQLAMQHSMARQNLLMSGAHLMMTHANIKKLTGQDMPIGESTGGEPPPPQEDADEIGNAPGSTLQLGQRFMDQNQNQGEE